MADTKCLKCKKLVTGNRVCCDECDGWLHLKCASMTLKSFKNLVEDPSLTFFVITALILSVANAISQYMKATLFNVM